MPKTAITGSLIELDLVKQSEMPMYRQITDGLRHAITAGRLAAGTKLPSTRIFADELGVSRNTILQVFDALKDEGLLTGQIGAGTYVSARLADSAPPAGPRPALDGHGTGKPQPGGAYPFRSLSRRGRSLVQSTTAEFAENPTPFMPDIPDLREFPIRTWLRLLNETSGRLTGQILVDTSNAGYEPLRRAIAQHLNASRGMACDYSQVIVTTGSQQGIDLVCRLLLDAGDPVWVEEPGYVGARSVIEANRGTICPVPTDDMGMRVQEAQQMHPVPRLVFISPSRHYPLGAMMSPDRRAALVEFARRNGTWLLEDDYDHEFVYSGVTQRSVFAMDGAERTIHMGTFSKILLPSFRLGYLVVPRDLSAHFAKARAVVDRHASLIEQMALSEFMNRGLFVSHIRRMRTLYQARRNRLMAGLEDILGPGACLPAPNSGTHLILPFHPGTDDVAIARRCAERGLVMRPLTPYYATRPARSGVLLGFSAFNEVETARGLKALSMVRDALIPLISSH